jgi:hypothetical protein
MYTYTESDGYEYTYDERSAEYWSDNYDESGDEE